MKNQIFDFFILTRKLNSQGLRQYQNADCYEKPDGNRIFVAPSKCTFEINVVVWKTKFLVGKYSRTPFKKLYFSILRSVDLNKSKRNFFLLKKFLWSLKLPFITKTTIFHHYWDRVKWISVVGSNLPSPNIFK